MTGGMMLGLGLFVVSAFHVIPALLFGTIPSNWPVYPLTREAKPVAFQITLGVMLGVGAAGLGLVLGSLVQGPGG